MFLEVNPRLQVEHTVTEQVTGLDLVAVQLRLATGASLADLGLTDAPVSSGVAVQARLNAERVTADGEVHPGGGELTRFVPPTGRGVRVDTHCAPGQVVNPRYDPLLAKVIATGTDLGAAALLAEAALGAFEVTGSPTNRELLRTLLRSVGSDTGVLTTDYVDTHIAELVPDEPDPEPARSPDDVVAATRAGVVVELPAGAGDDVGAGRPLVVLEAMKMEYVLPAPGPVRVREVLVELGQAVAEGTPLLAVEPSSAAATDAAEDEERDLDAVRADLAEVLERRHATSDAGRAEVVERRHAAGRRTARECVEQLCDPDTFLEYGAFAVAAQRRRRDMADLIVKTPGDGMVCGTARVGGVRCAVLSYDYTVLAGTQGVQNHRKTDRLLELARRERLPVVLFAEGGGGRPGDTDQPGFTGLDVPTFRLAAELAGRVPTIGVVSGYCFAGNAALAAVCDVLIGTEGSSLGMGGPPMISGGGLGEVAPGDVGPMPVQLRNGVLDVLAPDDETAVDVARRYLSYLRPTEQWECADQRELRWLVPENRVRAYPVRPVLETLFDTGSVLELRTGYGVGMVTAFARLAGKPVGVYANDPDHLGGAIDAEAADKAARFLTVCDTYRLPVVVLCDTPGFMVGPDAEQAGLVRSAGAMFTAGAHLRSPLAMIVLRKGYGLGAMAMAGGALRSTALSASWPTGEFGGMNFDGAVRLGYRKELDAIDDPDARQARFEELVARAYRHGRALSTATVFDIDDVIDPADTRAALTAALGLD
jgi:acetyl-CoA carboxylase carboxyltransferase component/biotin carboxyl carrier protein